MGVASDDSLAPLLISPDTRNPANGCYTGIGLQYKEAMQQEEYGNTFGYRAKSDGKTPHLPLGLGRISKGGAMSDLRKTFLITAAGITFIGGSMFWFLRDSLGDWRVSFMIGCIWLAGMLGLAAVVMHKKARQ